MQQVAADRGEGGQGSTDNRKIGMYLAHARIQLQIGMHTHSV